MSNGNHVDEFWRSHNFRMEPWGNNYEPPIQIAENLALSESDVNPTMETEDWENFESPKARYASGTLKAIASPPSYLY